MLESLESVSGSLLATSLCKHKESTNSEHYIGLDHENGSIPGYHFIHHDHKTLVAKRKSDKVHSHHKDDVEPTAQGTKPIIGYRLSKFFKRLTVKVRFDCDLGHNE
jgi:hypothetical protein